MASAVHTTLYGALLAHLVCHPLAAAIARRARAEQRARAALAEWFLAQLARCTPAAPPARAHLRGVA
jgi:chemotaxis protein MotA